METVKDLIDGKYGKSKYKLESYYRKKYDEDMTFRKIANELDLPEETLMKYTTKLSAAACEYNNCKNCKNILECKNEVSGYIYYPNRIEKEVEFAYRPCKYKTKLDKENTKLANIYYYDIPKDIKNAKMKDIDLLDKNRFEVIKWMKEYITNTKKNIYQKGIYLNGNFGCGKTYLLSAMLNEIAKTGKTIAIVYYPEFLRSLKEAFYDNEEYKKRFNFIKKDRKSVV